MSHLTVPQRDRLTLVLAVLDDNIDQAERREVREVLYACKRAIEYLAIPRPQRQGAVGDLGKA